MIESQIHDETLCNSNDVHSISCKTMIDNKD